LKPNTCLVVDVWEGQREIDEVVLKANGVYGIGIRINDMNGGHHLDSGFTRQWHEAANLVRFPYFVYNPWASGLANFEWLVAHMPASHKSVAVDIEVRRPGYSAADYAGEVTKFIELCKSVKWRTIIYTAQWFLPNLSKWPKTDYWWAQYPDPAAHFSGVKTWEDLKLRLDKLTVPENHKAAPGKIRMWQFSGDYLILPGNPRDMDVNIFYGTPAELSAYFRSPLIDEEPTTEDPGQIPNTPGLFIFSLATYRMRAAGSLLTTTLSNITKMSENRTSLLLNNAWKNYLRGINNTKAYAKIITKDGSISKGLNSKGLLELNTLIYPGRNILRVLKTTTGIDGALWGLVETISSTRTPPASVNYIDTPHLFQRVYGSDGKGSWSTLDNSPLVPLVSDGDIWVQMQWLEPVSICLPRMVQVKSHQGMNVRTKPDMYSPRFSVLYHGQTIKVHDIEIGKGGIWGHTNQGWISLRYKDLNLTDWSI